MRVPMSAATENSAIRPFQINISEEQIVDLRKRISATEAPERKVVPDQSQGVRLATILKLARYWGTEYDRRRCGDRLASGQARSIARPIGCSLANWNKERSMKVENSLTPAHFLERARLYPLAAAIADAQRDAAMFRNLTTMFEQLAQHPWSSVPVPTSVVLPTVLS
jgi:Epoxide hydrolase N terminus